MTGKTWEDFRQRLRELYESATGDKLCSGRSDRQVGVATIKKIILAYGYRLERDEKNYKLKKETKPICST